MQKILLVEDNEMNRDLISRRLRRKGFEVVMAKDGAEGVEKATSERPSLILMDMGLPIIDGYEATRIVKGHDGTRHIPIIGLSAHAMSGDADRALEAGCDDYDTKPVEWPRLLAKVQNQLDRATQTTALSSDAIRQETAAEVQQAGAKVLVVDDNTLHCEVLASRLNTLGYRYDIAQSREQALQLLSENTFQAMLLDVGLDDQAGESLLGRLRHQESTRHMAVLLVCSTDALGRAVSYLSRGADDVLPQPFQIELLSARLTASLERRRLEDEVKQLAPRLEDAQRRAAHLMQVLLPAAAVLELQQTQQVQPKRHGEVTILQCDIVNFSRWVDEKRADEVLERFQRLVVGFEEAVERHRLIKVKTSGDTFVAAAGLFEPHPSGPLAAIRCALEMKHEAVRLGGDWSLRFGLSEGPVTSAVVGRRRYQFDLYGGTLDRARLIKNHGAINAVNVSAGVWQRVAGRCTGQPLEPAILKDGSSLPMFRIDRASEA